MANSQEHSQEIRFAIVMYGGVSLAIYIHGVAQELLRLARSTSAVPDTDLDAIELIYRRMSNDVRALRNPTESGPAPKCPTRFIIDILSGTSAGGINAIFLAKALAIGARNLDNLRNTWLEVADLNRLLNLANPGEPKRSLLDGNWMYKQLYLAFNEMKPGAASSAPTMEELDQLDLFVTTTDLNGVQLPMRLTDMDIVEKIHKGFFHFRLDNFSVTKHANVSEEDRRLETLRRDDFTAACDPMLAFAARATSSFPVAFAPFKLADIAAIIGSATYEKNKEAFLKFYRWIPKNPLVKTGSAVDIEQRELADGGYLNNKPFDHVIDALTFRATRLPHSRKLLFVDPFPEMAGDQKVKRHFNFVENARDAAMTLPQYQTIRQEIERIKDLNRTLIRLGEIHSRTGASPGHKKGSFDKLSLGELTASYGAAYTTYHAVRLFDTTDDLAHLVSSIHEIEADDDLFLAVRYLVRAWRTETYSADEESGKLTETRFFTDFDYSFRLRRAIHLLEWMQNKPDSAEICNSLIRQITRLLRKREQMSSFETGNPLAANISELGKAITWDKVKQILIPIPDSERYDSAAGLYNQMPELRSFAEAIATQWKIIFDQNRIELKICRNANKALDSEYESFDFGDMVSLAFLEGSNVSEHTETEIYRVSPADGTKASTEDKIDLDKKLAGYKIGDFGAFLKRDYRLNDMLFGRLDACERIVSSIFNQQCDLDLREGYIEELRRAIIAQECEAGMNALAAVAASGLPQAQALRNFYTLPSGPERQDSARQIAQASNILGRMFEDDLNKKGGVFSSLQTAGKLSTTLISFLTPRSLPNLFFHHWLGLAALASGLLFCVAFFLKQTRIETVGLDGLVASLVIWLLAWFIGRYLTHVPIPRWLRILLAALVTGVIIAVVLSGVHHVWPDLAWLYAEAASRFQEIFRKIVEAWSFLLA